MKLTTDFLVNNTMQPHPHKHEWIAHEAVKTTLLYSAQLFRLYTVFAVVLGLGAIAAFLTQDWIWLALYASTAIFSTYHAVETYKSNHQLKEAQIEWRTILNLKARG